VVTYSFNIDNIPRISLKEVENVVNIVFKRNFPDIYPEDGIRSRSRRSIVVTFRFIFFKVARDMFYPLKPIAKYLGYNHATILHAVKTVDNLIETNDHVVITYYNLVRNEIKTRIDNNADVPDTIGEEYNS
jgi:chromosomal replication initiation ATPase DnaA